MFGCWKGEGDPGKVLFRVEKAKFYLALGVVKVWMDVGGQLQYPPTFARKLRQAAQTQQEVRSEEVSRKMIFFLKSSGSLLYFSFLFYLLISICIL